MRYKPNTFIQTQNKLTYDRNPSPRYKKQKHNNHVQKKLHKHRKIWQNKKHYALESEIIKSDLKPLTKGLYSKHKMFETMFSLESIQTPITLNYLQ
jgi:hypothetical protein